jgi:hypothetical protein
VNEVRTTQIIMSYNKNVPPGGWPSNAHIPRHHHQKTYTAYRATVGEESIFTSLLQTERT